MNAEQRQVAAGLCTKPTYLSDKPACRRLGNYVDRRHLVAYFMVICLTVEDTMRCCTAL